MNTNIKVLLSQTSNGRYPTCHVRANDIIQSYTIDRPTWAQFNLDLEKNSVINFSVEHYGKTEVEFNNSQDTAVIIEKIVLNGISRPEFVWKGIFNPDYPSWEKEQGSIETFYLGFNGVWECKFSVPIYTWIHDTLNFGWIYD